MKKLIFALLMMVATFSMQAQVNGETNSSSSTPPQVKSESVLVDKDLNPDAGFYEFAWKNVDHGTMIGWHLGVKYVVIGFDLSWSSAGSGKYSSKSDGWDIFAGARYRYRIIDRLWVEGIAALGYYHNKVTVGSGKDKVEKSAGKFGIMLQPRIGFNIYKGWGLFAGYRWDAAEFKFEKSGGLTAGLVVSF